LVRDQEAVGSNPATPTIKMQEEVFLLKKRKKLTQKTQLTQIS
jgi:hypothetical protein